MRKTAVLLLLVALAGCGGDDDSPETQPTSPPTTRSQIELDKDRAARAVFTAADLPGYEEDSSVDEDTPEEKAAFAACVQNDPVLIARAPDSPRTAEGPTFVNEEGRRVQTTVTVAETEAQAAAALVKLRERTVIDCLGRQARAAAAQEGVTAGSLTASPLQVTPAGDEAVGLRIQGSLSAEGETARVTFDTTAIRKDRAVGFLTTGGIDTTIPDAERAALATKLADRMAA